MKAVKIIFALMATTLVASCSMFSSSSADIPKDKNYMAAKSIAPLRIPQGVSSSAFKNKYPVSDKHYTKAQMDVDLIPPGLTQS